MPPYWLRRISTETATFDFHWGIKWPEKIRLIGNLLGSTLQKINPQSWFHKTTSVGLFQKVQSNSTENKTNIFFWCFTNQEQCWTYNVVSIYQLVGGFSPFEKYYSKWVHLPQFSGWKWKKIFELPPPRSRIHIWMKYFPLHQPQGKSRWLSSNLPGSDIHHLLHGVSREIDFCCPPNT